MDDTKQINGLSGLVIDEEKLIDVIIEKKLDEKMSRNIVHDLMSFQIFGIPFKYFLITGLLSTVLFKIFFASRKK